MLLFRIEKSRVNRVRLCRCNSVAQATTANACIKPSVFGALFSVCVLFFLLRFRLFVSLFVFTNRHMFSVGVQTFSLYVLYFAPIRILNYIPSFTPYSGTM